MSVPVGPDLKVYYSTAGAGGTPTWVELTIAQEVSWEPAWDEAEASTRGSRYKKFVPGMADVPVSIDILRVLTNTQYEAMRDAWKNRTTLGICIAGGDRTTTGVERFTADMFISGFAVSEPLAEASTVSLTLKVDARGTTEPTIDEAT